MVSQTINNKLENLSKVDYAVYGMPFEEGSINRGGTRNAPASIREDYSPIDKMGYSDIFHVNVPSYLTGTDMGDVDIDFGYKKSSLDEIEKFVKSVIDYDILPIGIGGGQLSTLAELRAVKEKYGPVALVHLDSSRDCRDCEEKYDDSTFFIRAIEEKLIIPENSIQLGIRGGYESKSECDYGKDLGVKVLTAAQMHKMTASDVVNDILQVVKDSACFITYDMSFLDPIYAPAVTTPVVGGFSTRYLNKILRGIAKELNTVAFDIVDLSASYDPMNITSQAAVSNINEFLVGLAKRKQIKEENENEIVGSR